MSTMIASPSSLTRMATSAGSPTRYTTPLKEAGLTVFHVVPTLKGAQRAIDAAQALPTDGDAQRERYREALLQLAAQLLLRRS